MTTRAAAIETATEEITGEQHALALRQHLASHRVGADERWDTEALQAFHALAHA